MVTVQELKQCLSETDRNDTFIVQCFVTHFDLDGPLSQLITRRWYRHSRVRRFFLLIFPLNPTSIFCNRSIRGDDTGNECSEAECRMKLLEQTGEENLSSKEVFNLTLHLTDHTGSISNVKLGDDVARKMLKCSVRQIFVCHSFAWRAVHLGR